MIKKSNKNKYLLFVIVSWLLARLRWTLEMSRLAFFRSHHLAQMRLVIQRNETLAICDWSLEQDHLQFVEYNSTKNVMTLHRFSVLVKN